MSNAFFERPILNSPYELPSLYWELDASGQPTQREILGRRPAEYVTPIPKPRKQKQSVQTELDLVAEGGLYTEQQKYDPIPIINELRYMVDQWRKLPSPNDWRVTPQTARLLQHWRQHRFQSFRPFFCQIEAVETAIWLSEVAPVGGRTGSRFGCEGVSEREVYLSIPGQYEYLVRKTKVVCDRTDMVYCGADRTLRSN